MEKRKKFRQNKVFNFYWNFPYQAIFIGTLLLGLFFRDISLVTFFIEFFYWDSSYCDIPI